MQVYLTLRDSKDNTTQLNSHKTVIVKDKWAASGEIQTHNTLPFQTMLYQLILSYVLYMYGNNWWGQRSWTESVCKCTYQHPSVAVL